MVNSVNHIYVKKYISGTTWNFVDGDTQWVLITAIITLYYPNLAVCNNQLYLSWVEHNGRHPANTRPSDMYGGSTWTSIDGNVNTGLNLSEPL